MYIENHTLNLKQLRLLCEMVNNDYSVSRTADTLFTTQPAISTQLKAFEDELNLKLFSRNGKRVTGLSDAGEIIYRYAEQALLNIETIRQVAGDFSSKDTGKLRIATTHTQARYALPPIIKRFSKRYPKVQLNIHQGSPSQITDMVLHGKADFAIATEGIASNEKLAMLPVYQWNRCVIAQKDHEIVKIKKLSLEHIAKYPIVTYDVAFAGRSIINKAFAENNLHPNIVLTAIDSDVIKTYVELGLGIGLVASMAYDKKQDVNLRSKDASHLFEDSTTYIGFKKGQFLREYMIQFIEWFAPSVTQEEILETIK